MHHYQHLLSKHGILNAFNIAKKVRQAQINAIKKRLEKKNIDPKKLDKELNKEIKKHTQKILDNTEIPGLITDYKGPIDDIKIDAQIQRKILSLANKATEYCTYHKFSKEHVIFFIQAVFHLLKITNEDMNNFKKKYNINQDPPDDYLDDDEDEF